MLAKTGLFILFIPFCLSQEIIPLDEFENATEIDPNYDYIVKLAYNIEESKVPQYLINLIYDKPLDKVLYTSDIISLFDLQRLTIQKTKDVLDVLDTPHDRLFSLDGLEHLLTTMNMEFKDFYNNLKNHLYFSGLPLRNALISLGIDSGRFSDALAFGDPDPFEEFKKGNFSQESLENACVILNTSLEDLYAGARNVILVDIENYPPNKVTEILAQHGIDKAVTRTLWTTLNITLEHVYNVTTFKKLFEDIKTSLTSNLTLGIVNDQSSISINRKTHEIWKEEHELLSIYAETFETSTLLSVQEVLPHEYKNVVILKFVPVDVLTESILSFVRIGYSEKNLENCQYVTIQQNGLVTKSIDSATYHRSNSYYEIPRNDVAEIVLGSPLVCDNLVFGIASDLNEKSILLDTFSSGYMMIPKVLVVVSSVLLSCYMS